jgi:hypothetical protein
MSRPSHPSNTLEFDEDHILCSSLLPPVISSPLGPNILLRLPEFTFSPYNERLELEPIQSDRDKIVIACIVICRLSAIVI